ncbi:EAL domain-containing protein [Roseomonas sp. CCTCC AB2023176]|uniref:EAL domain-containing protein n=1 Tax=Roseomonas sp. CCTCC AB2023176 TaxID=3342640 RepID=UPI0035D60AB5
MPAAPDRPGFGPDILDDLTTGIMTLDEAGTVLGLNGAAERLLGPAPLLGRRIAEAVPPLAAIPLAAVPMPAIPLAAVPLAAVPDGLRHGRTTAPDDRLLTIGERAVLARLRPCRDRGWLLELADLGANPPRLGLDPLTRLPTRDTLLRRLEDVAADARGPGCTKAALLCLDLDRFKLVNDTLGHPMGDALLRTVAERLRCALRDADLPARLGGDEFAVVQMSDDPPRAAAALAARLVDLLGRAYLIEGHMLNIGASVGVALIPADGTDPAEILRHADLALYDAKSAGRGTHRFYEPGMSARMQARRTLETDLRRALALKQFALEYQPLLDARTGAVSGFEALLRWRHPERGLVSPAEFVPLTEELGLIVPIGAWVLRAACREAAAWPEPVGISVNLSPVQFRDPGLLRTVTGALSAAGLDPARLTLEITEGALIENPDETFRALGLRIAMDDFGTGYSSLTQLQRFPFDKVKIDRSFVAEMTTDRDCAAIVRAVAGLGASLGVHTSAEGVETTEQWDQLREDGCGEVQGFLISRPLSSEAARAFLATRPNRAQTGESACPVPSTA